MDTPTVTTLGQRELNLLSPHFSNPHLRGLIISRADKVLFNRVISEFPISHYSRESQRIDFLPGGWLLIAPIWAYPSLLSAMDFNVVAIEDPYPDNHVKELILRINSHNKEDIPPTLYYAGELRSIS